MSGDLESFLKQAALRRQQRAAGNAPAPPVLAPQPVPVSPPPPASPPRQRPLEGRTISQESFETQSSSSLADVVDAEIVEMAVDLPNRKRVEPPVRDLGRSVGHLSGPSESVDQADERIAAHLTQTFQHQLGRINPAPVAASSTDDMTSTQPTTQRLPTTTGMKQNDHPLLKMLRKPDTIRSAFLASEIFKRPF